MSTIEEPIWLLESIEKKSNEIKEHLENKEIIKADSLYIELLIECEEMIKIYGKFGDASLSAGRMFKQMIIIRIGNELCRVYGELRVTKELEAIL